MKFRGLDGSTHTLSLNGYIVTKDDRRKRSSYHQACRELLNEMFPLTPILEEVPLPGSGGLFCDFFLPRESLIIEVHGEQHYKFVPHFHQTKKGFAQACARDRRKGEWCDENNITLIVLPYNEDADGWRERIRDR